MLEAALAAGVAAGGGHALLGGVLPTPGAVAAGAPLRLRPGRGRLRLAQPLPGQRHQVLRRPTAPSSTTTQEAEIEAPAGGARRRRAPGPRARAARRRRPTTCASSRRASPTSTSTAPRCCSTAPTAPPTASRPRSSAASAPTSTRIAVEPDGRNINRDCGSTHVEHARRATSAATTSASPSTATATACWRSTATATVVDGDELMALAALHLRDARPAARQRRGRHRDDQLRLPPGDARARGGGGDHAGRRPLRAGRAARSAAGRSAASSPATSSTPASCPPATAPPPPC